MKDIEIDQTFTFNGTNFHLWAEVRIDCDYDIRAHELNIFNEDTQTDVVTFKAETFYPRSLDEIIDDETFSEKVESVILNEVDEGILAW
jgi:hypothetical protein